MFENIICCVLLCFHFFIVLNVFFLLLSIFFIILYIFITYFNNILLSNYKQCFSVNKNFTEFESEVSDVFQSSVLSHLLFILGSAVGLVADSDTITIVFESSTQTVRVQSTPPKEKA